MMATATATMPRPKRDDIPVKMDAGVVHICKIVAAYRNISLAEYLSETMKPVAEKSLAEYSAKGPPPPIKPGRKKGRADGD